jgi:biopolymer transport protein ExbB
MHEILRLLAKGGFVMIPLALCSILALSVAVERAWFWLRARALADADAVLGHAGWGRWDEARRVGAASASPVARVLAAGLAHRDGALSPALQAAAREESQRSRRYLPVLDTIITLSPLLGLLGTVTGMIGAFGVMAQSGMSAPTAITGGVAEALVATAAGLAVAIGALVPFNIFSARAEAMLDTIERYASRLELILTDGAESSLLDDRGELSVGARP